MDRNHTAFQKTIGALWEKLGLQPPRFTDPGRVQMRVESIALDLVDDGRGRLIIEGSAGRLARDEARRQAQIRRVLKTNLGFLVQSEAAVYLKPVSDSQVVLAVRATHGYAAKIDRLIRKIENVVQSIEYYSGEMKLVDVQGIGHSVATSTSTEPAVIFRP